MSESSISESIIFVSNQKIKEGKLEGYKQYYRQVAEMTERTKPGTVAHLAYANDEGTEVSIIHIFPDAESMAVHMRGVGELTQKAYEFMEIASFEIYGNPGGTILEKMQQIVGSKIEIHLKSQNIGGYIRLKSG